MSGSLRATRGRLPLAVLLVVVLTLYAVPFASAAPAAFILIDHFDAAQGPLVATTPGTPVSGSVSGPNVLGAERDLQVTIISGAPRTASAQAVNSQLLHSQDTGIVAETLVQWDGTDGSMTLNPNGLGGADLTQSGTQDRLAITVVFNDLPIDLEFTAYSGANSSRATLSLPGNQFSGSIDYYIPFASFTTVSGSGANFSSIGALELRIRGNVGGSDLTIEDIRTEGLDWGDLPDASVPGGHPNYPTKSVNNGPSHVIGGLYLGDAIDSESDGLPSIGATGDDNNGIVDDEDGVVRTPNVKWNSGANGGSVNVTVTGGPGCLSGWIDWNNNGNLLDTGENILSNVLVNTGTSTHAFAIPVDPHNGTFYARFRLFAPDAGGGCTSAKAPTGQAVNGEVEDYRWGFGPNAVNVSSFGAVASPVAWPVAGGAIASAAVLLAGLRRLLRP
ncbi:MAG: GEVED domain-containing protein [Nitrososphaerales archaeon]